MELSGRLTFATDMLLMPVRDLPDDSRARLDCDADDFAVSRLHGRGGSKIVDAQAAGLLESFRKPRTVIEAVVLFSRERQLDPNEVLESAYPLLRGLLAGGFLVPAEGEDGELGVVEAGRPTWTAGTLVGASTIERCLQVLDDTEVYAVARDGARSVLKVERRMPHAPRSTAVRQRLDREAAILAHLGGTPAAALVGHGEIEGRRYLELELVAGVEATTAAAEWRDRGEAGRPALRALLHSIAASYAELHRRGIVHGDVHPRNVLVCADGTVRLIDFGAARATDPAGGLPAEADRGGVPFFYEPELAAAAIAGTPEPPPASEAGEQFAVAALLYFLATGAHWRDFSLGRDEMLREIAQEEPLPFRDRGVAAWPELEAVLSRAMAKRPEERYAGVDDLVDALEAIPEPMLPRPAPSSAPPLERLVRGALDAASLDGPWWSAGLDPAPRVSVNYGAAGLALGLLQIAQRRGDPGVLAAADAWAQRAAAGVDDEGAFYNPEIEITREMVGESSIYHSPSGVHAVQALVARAMADPRAQAQATTRFLAAAGLPANGLDLTLGRSSLLLGAAILLDALPSALEEQGSGASPLRAFGDETLAELWRELDGRPDILHDGLEYAGIAHGWAGFVYATLQWCMVAGSAVPSGAERRLAELAALGFPAGRGRAWPWVLRHGEEPATMSGWCNGSSGYVFLWTLAHRSFGDPRYLDLAVGAAWDAWDGGDSVPTLCCGAAGRAYALLDLHRLVGEPVWLDRARDLARQAEHAGGRDDYPHSLWKGGFGLAVLAADLDRPEEAAMPLFEPAGYRARAAAG